ncbi:MAG: DUF4440 domain-containing protein [Bacteroidetes bacterium]|nr:MAG: DUF4440 domain-containing protein [Bacteroidota bacterium]
MYQSKYPVPVILLVLLVAGGLMGCQRAQPETPPPAAPVEVDLTAARAAIDEVDRAYGEAMRAGDAETIVALHAGDAVVLPPDAPVLRGKAAIAQAFREYYAEPLPVTLQLQEVVVASSGDLAYVIGASNGADGNGKYLTVLRRTADGWVIVADAWNNDQPTPTGEEM